MSGALLGEDVQAGKQSSIIRRTFLANDRTEVRERMVRLLQSHVDCRDPLVQDMLGQYLENRSLFDISVDREVAIFDSKNIPTDRTLNSYTKQDAFSFAYKQIFPGETVVMEPCSLPVAIRFALIYTDQPVGESLVFGMDPISCKGHGLRIFKLVHEPRRRVLLAIPGRLSDRFKNREKWLFEVRPPRQV